MAGKKLTPKQENFALAYLETGNASEAYRRVYNPAPTTKESTISRSAKSILDNPKIIARLEELRAPIREKACLTLEEHLSTLERLRNLAEQSEQFTAAITAETNRGKASGLYVERRENKTTLDGSVTVKYELPDDALAILRDLGAIPDGAA